MGDLRADRNEGGTGTLTISRAFDLLSDRRRRLVLHAVVDRDGPMAIEDVVATVCEQEADDADDRGPTDDRRERVQTTLTHNHLPRLVEAGVVRWDREAGTLERARAATVLAPFLDLVASRDLR